ncbi:hypothetical protein [Mycobacterium sp.]|uniref:hypothetical protein n=1 Tax=Mycobacterium sp. TaxID=1785 RepID=UPI00260ED05A|nr:hypothetical protein [Mycobacterium sp.]
MYVVATCTASVLRGTSTDTYGDTIDNSTVAATGIIASIREMSRTVLDPNTQEPRILRFVEGVMPAGTDVRDTDQIRDDTYGVTYFVEAVTQNREPGFTPDLKLQLKRVS